MRGLKYVENELTSSKSILLNYSNFNLSIIGNVFYFSNCIRLNGFDYKDLTQINSWFSKTIGYGVVNGDGRGTIQISTKDKEPIYYLFGANRCTSNASNIARGYHNSDKKCFFYVKALKISIQKILC